MDTRQALKILNLSDDAALEDAKTSFRNLAKQFHPDKVYLQKKQINTHEKMQEINLAFQILKRTLKPKAKTIFKKSEPIKKPKNKRASPLKNLNTFIKTIQREFLKKIKTKTKPKKAKSPHSFNKQTRSNSFVKKNKKFDSVLNKTIKDSSNDNSKGQGSIFSNRNRSNKKINLKQNYANYMKLKQKIRSKRRHDKFEGFTPIEKISPITPIKKS